MNNEPERTSRFRAAFRLNSTRSCIFPVVLATLLVVSGVGALLAKSQIGAGKSSGLAVTATATATATPLPTPTATPRPRPTATHVPPKPPPSGPPNYLAVRIGGCGSLPYPNLYFTSTDPGKFDALYWYQVAPYPSQYLFGNEGAYIGVNHTEEVVVTPNNYSAGPLTYTVKADRTLNSVDYGTAGYWHGTVYPCK